MIGIVRKTFAAAAFFLTGAAAASPVTQDVVVTAPGLSGYWTVLGPNLIQLKLGALTGIRILYSGDTDARDICLLRYLAGKISATCGAGFSSDSGGDVTQGRVTLRWWHGPTNLIFSGVWDRKATIKGGFSGGLGGVKVTGTIPATMVKLKPSTALPASAPLMRQGLADLVTGTFPDDRYEPSAIKRMTRVENWPDAKYQGPLLAFLGAVHVHWQRGQPNLLEDVYQVRSGPDLSLCRISVSPRGRIDDFDCHKIDRT